MNRRSVAIGRHRPQAGLRLGQGDQIVVVQLDAPALVGGVLREHGAPQPPRSIGRLLAGVGAQLAAKHADRIVPLAQGAVVPVRRSCA